ncbi:tRNA pseudouridine(55) synthase TruB [Merismopedia glauca]|uniref:tRNA pseudouridine synthase B n=1 Tax=Merismopedia glauca CCAP 1448/3 TaxID=1296344 RepID=A0A2T1C0K0_9CYAN|nr:tRNA pseudouridine(55) synthase TruB [Merismopedia glauca]PSB01790.1 tRNA pseudouridine(55) synthase TruB [Merismopedia glauca CCAP 1448/3]
MAGFLNLNKPFGFTSHDCVAKVRRLLRLKKIGHGGTLDPAAVGVLPIAIGKATRLLQYLPSDKAYQATIRFGVTTTTDDLQGEVITSQAVDSLSLESVKTVLQQFEGKISQIPPKYSAIQVKGQRLYDLARSGTEVEVPVREVEVYGIEVLDWRNGDFPEVDLAIACGSGTYIRAIARDLGTLLHTGGTLAALTRTQSCGFQLADSLTFEQLETQLSTGIFTPISPATALQHLQVITLPFPEAKRWCQGQKILAATILNESQLSKSSEVPLITKIEAEDGSFLGISQLTKLDAELILIPQMVFEPVS